jgi:hypothetical protein
VFREEIFRHVAEVTSRRGVDGDRWHNEKLVPKDGQYTTEKLSTALPRDA